MFVLLYNDDSLQRMTVLDTSDNVVETLPSQMVLSIMKESRVKIEGIEVNGSKCVVRSVPYPAKKLNGFPQKDCFIVSKVLITKRACDRTIKLVGYHVENMVLVRKHDVIFLDECTDISNIFFSQHTYVGLDDECSGDTFSWTIADGKCDVFKKKRCPYNVNCGTEVCKESLGDLIHAILKKGYLCLGDW